MLSNTSVWCLIRPLSAGVLFIMHTLPREPRTKTSHHKLLRHWHLLLRFNHHWASNMVLFQSIVWDEETTVAWFQFNTQFSWLGTTVAWTTLQICKYPSFFGSCVCSDWMPLASSEFFFQKAWLYLPQTRCNVLHRAQQLNSVTYLISLQIRCHVLWKINCAQTAEKCLWGLKIKQFQGTRWTHSHLRNFLTAPHYITWS